MTASEENLDIEFMLKRCLGLCLTDRKSAVANGQTIGFDILEENKAFSNSLYEPLALLSHSQRLITSFSKDVLPYLSSLVTRNAVVTGHGTSGANNSVATAKTALRDVVLRHERKTLNESDLLVCTLVGEEFLAHCEELLVVFDKERKEIKNTSMLALLDWSSNQLKQLRKSWESIAVKGRLPVARIQKMIAEGKNSTKYQDLPGFLIPENVLKPLYKDYARQVRIAKKVLLWRQRWKETTSGFGPGSKLKLHQTRSAPALFELWAFVELASALHEGGRQNLVQNSLLRGANENPLFSGKSGLDVYFDFHGNPQLLPPEHRVLNRVHVEWFLRNRNNYGDSVILDTKYKASESVNLLTTLGYMLAFQVNRGVVVFRENLDLGAFQVVESEQRFALCKFGGNQKQILCALQLVPRKEEMRHNARILQKLVDKVILE